MLGRPARLNPDLDVPIMRILDDMQECDPKSPEYQILLTQLARLVTLQNTTKKKQRISPDTMLMVAGNLLGILVIVAYEQKHVMVSKAQGFILKPKT